MKTDGNMRNARGISESVVNRHQASFWKKVNKLGEDDCWDWKAYVMPKGYGQFGINRKNKIYSHRFAYAHFHGYSSIVGVLILHRCDNRKCCNPKHLFAGTTKINFSDAVSKGRFRPKQMKLNPEKARLIRGMTGKNSEIANRFGVSILTVQRIKRGTLWADNSPFMACESHTV